MTLFFTAIKSMLWGLCVLILVAVGAINLITISSQLEKRLPVDIHNDVTVLERTIQPKLSKLESALDGKQYQLSQELINDIRKDIESICSNCQLRRFSALSSWDVSSFRDYLQARMKKEKTEENNRTYLIAALASIATTLLSIYLIAGLVVFRNNYKKAILLILSSIPVVLCLLALSALQMDSDFFYTKFGYNGSNINLVLLSVPYIFIGYPAIYAVANKLNISLKEVALLKA